MSTDKDFVYVGNCAVRIEMKQFRLFINIVYRGEKLEQLHCWQKARTSSRPWFREYAHERGVRSLLDGVRQDCRVWACNDQSAAPRDHDCPPRLTATRSFCARNTKFLAPVTYTMAPRPSRLIQQPDNFTTIPLQRTWSPCPCILCQFANGDNDCLRQVSD